MKDGFYVLPMTDNEVILEISGDQYICVGEGRNWEVGEKGLVEDLKESQWKEIECLSYTDLLELPQGSIVKPIKSSSSFYLVGETYTIGKDGHDDFGPLDKDGDVMDFEYVVFTLVSKPATKTIQDALSDGANWHNVNNKETLSEERPIIGYDPKEDLFFSCRVGYPFEESDGEYLVGNYVDNVISTFGHPSYQERKYMYEGSIVKWLADKPDAYNLMAIQRESGEFEIANVNAMSYVKPDITKAQAWDLVNNSRWNPTDVNIMHNVVD